nr:MAG TPA: hypothetical protein [Caudoviricetes sp.]
MLTGVVKWAGSYLTIVKVLFGLTWFGSYSIIAIMLSCL